MAARPLATGALAVDLRNIRVGVGDFATGKLDVHIFRAVFDGAAVYVVPALGVA